MVVKDIATERWTWRVRTKLVERNSAPANWPAATFHLESREEERHLSVVFTSIALMDFEGAYRSGKPLSFGLRQATSVHFNHRQCTYCQCV
jgi:hypothetical protein